MAPRKFFVGGNRKCMKRDWRGHEEDRDCAQRGRGALGVGGRRLSSDLICPRLQLPGHFVWVLVFEWIDLCADLRVVCFSVMPTEVVVSPPFVFLQQTKGLLRLGFAVAVQNRWVRKGGAFTCEISAEMLVNLQVPWAILGHSERRALLGESNDFVADKVAYALSQGLKVIACIGETLEQREAGTTMDVVAAQTKAIAGT